MSAHPWVCVHTHMYDAGSPCRVGVGDPLRQAGIGPASSPLLTSHLSEYPHLPSACMQVGTWWSRVVKGWTWSRNLGPAHSQLCDLFRASVSESENWDDNYNDLFVGREIKQKVHSLATLHLAHSEYSTSVSCCSLLPLARLSKPVPGCFSGLQNILQSTCLLHGPSVPLQRRCVRATRCRCVRATRC